MERGLLWERPGAQAGGELRGLLEVDASHTVRSCHTAQGGKGRAACAQHTATELLSQRLMRSLPSAAPHGSLFPLVEELELKFSCPPFSSWDQGSERQQPSVPSLCCFSVT